MAQMSMSHIRLLLRRETPFTVHDMMEDIVLADESIFLSLFFLFNTMNINGEFSELWRTRHSCALIL